MHTDFEENYTDGQLVSGKATLDDGKIIAYTKSRNVPPQFKGGVEGFGKYLSNNIEYPVSARQNNKQGRVVLTFVVEKNGQITDIKILNPVDPDIDNEAVRVLRNSPKWIPGTMFGSAVRVQYSVPVSFALSGN